ncbi:MAG: rhodanese [Sphingomonadales bacterium]|nr:rhodanese [Sphingomonadales bacterium]MDE2570590.1 rhodanese [Sphingomonadales bacterium]
MLRWFAAVLLLLAAGPALAGEPALFDAGGYRAQRYRAPVDLAPAPARRIALTEALGLEPGRDAIFIDVNPAPGARRDPVTGAWQLAEAHQTIPGALWFPETGRADPDPRLWRALRRRIAQLRHRRAHAPVVVFCRADCWMSWNAARRLALDGVSGVHWLAEGIDGWHDAGARLVDGAPVPVRGGT